MWRLSGSVAELQKMEELWQRGSLSKSQNFKSYWAGGSEGMKRNIRGEVAPHSGPGVRQIGDTPAVTSAAKWSQEFSPIYATQTTS